MKYSRVIIEIIVIIIIMNLCGGSYNHGYITQFRYYTPDVLRSHAPLEQL